jgi:hypothetical protein
VTAPSVEILIPRTNSAVSEPMLRALARVAAERGHAVRLGDEYSGKSKWLVLFGVGAVDRDRARRRQIANGGHAICWDMGYVVREKGSGHLRLSIDQDHPHRWLDATVPDPSRWDSLGVPLREDANPNGPIILVGLGGKSRTYLRAPNWEAEQLDKLERRFPGRKVVHRPKPGHDYTKLRCERDTSTPIDKLLRGTSLVVCRHSNVAVDAVIAGVPFECVDGAAFWLIGKDFTVQNRLDFLRRLAWWQWRVKEADQAWDFIVRTLGAESA